ncbi:MAG: hypothetical protein KJ072_20750 [Verrucomicrobia bacterium]|nr:hypothetical protein [Verrucomicrobiota bacterium]
MRALTTLFTAAFLGALSASAESTAVDSTTNAPPKFRSPEDGWLDLKTL